MRRKRALVNTLTAISFQLITLAVGFILPRLYIDAFGSTYNGLNQTVAQIMKLLAVLQAGIGAASIQALFKPIAENDKNTVTAIFKYIDKQYKRMGYAFIIILMAVTITWTIISQEELPIYLIPTFLIIYGLSSSMEYFFQAKYNIILIAHNKSYYLYLINIFLFLVSTALKILILINIKNIVVYLSVLLVVALLRMVIIKIFIRKHYPYLAGETTVTDFEIKARKDVFISETAGMVIGSTDLVVLTITGNLAYASIYSIYNLVVSGLSSLLGSVREGFFAGMGQLYNENFNRFKKRFDEFESLYFTLMFVLYSIAIVLYMPFIEIYTEGMDINYVYKYFPVMFVGMNLIVSLRIPSIILINTAGHFKEVKNYAVVEAVLNLVISFVLSLRIGIYGVLIGTIVGGIYRTPILANYSNVNIAKRKNWVYIRKVIILSIPFIIASAFSLSVHIYVESFIQWIKLGLIVSLAVTFIYMFILFFIERALVKSSIATIVRRK
jgi:O-antigen/teichoic acid export membrane protein